MKNNDFHGGNSRIVAERLGLGEIPPVEYDFSVNLNPLGMPLCVERALQAVDAGVLMDYPRIYAEDAVQALAAAHDTSAERIVVGNGSTEVFSWIVSVFSPQKAAGIAPCYSGYADVCEAAGVSFEHIATASPEKNFELPELSLKDVDMLFIGSPNNPTGVATDKSLFLEIAKSNPDTIIVVDESFIDFLPNSHEKSLIGDDLPDNLIVVKSLTKFFSIAGLRLGMGYASGRTTAKIAKARLPWSVNGLAQKIAPLLYQNQTYLGQSTLETRESRDYLTRLLEEIPEITIFPSEANFVLCRVDSPAWNAETLQAELLKRGYLIRCCSMMRGLDNRYFRLAVKRKWENEALFDEISAVLGVKASRKAPKRRAKGIMVVGTTSGAGKSVFAAALCRYFARKGRSVAPFKAQNMSLNSFVTREGGEMGRAQVVQAYAAGVEPHTDMNPVLLKPTGDKGSQLIVDGQPLCNVTARSYYDEKNDVRQRAFAAYERLANQHDIIILEGAGSPAEINLLERDFVNMPMAEQADASTILVADIDPGGVFASILGTISLIPAQLRRYLKGVVINKFRGDVTLLDGAIKDIEKLTRVPVLGVAPYLTDLRIEEEDSMGLRSRGIRKENQLLDIVVVRLPRISNYTDFLPFEKIDGATPRYVSNAKDFGTPDLILLPGTKNTRSDMAFLDESGLKSKIITAYEKGTRVVGICGGYQMLGRTIADPDGVEDEPGESEGLGLLPLKTILEQKKELARVSGKVEANETYWKKGTTFEGYEIHMGRTDNLEDVDAPLLISERRGEKVEEHVGALSNDGKAFGCYVHGFFDSKPIRDQLLKQLCDDKGIDFDELMETENDQDDAFDQLADMLENHIDMKQVESWI